LEVSKPRKKENRLVRKIASRRKTRKKKNTPKNTPKKKKRQKQKKKVTINCEKHIQEGPKDTSGSGPILRIYSNYQKIVWPKLKEFGGGKTFGGGKRTSKGNE